MHSKEYTKKLFLNIFQNKYLKGQRKESCVWAGLVWKFPIEARFLLGLVNGEVLVRGDKLHFLGWRYRLQERNEVKEAVNEYQKRHAGSQQNHNMCKGLFLCTLFSESIPFLFGAPCLEGENSQRIISSEWQVEKWLKYSWTGRCHRPHGEGRSPDYASSCV